MIRLSGAKLHPVSGSGMQFQFNSSSAHVLLWVLEKDKDKKGGGLVYGNLVDKIPNLDEQLPVALSFLASFHSIQNTSAKIFYVALSLFPFILSSSFSSSL